MIGAALGATIDPKLEYAVESDVSEGGCECCQLEEKSMGGLDLSVRRATGWSTEYSLKVSSSIPNCRRNVLEGWYRRVPTSNSLSSKSLPCCMGWERGDEIFF